ncbi:NUDIX hydrolase [Breznakiella homolactica]|uniref:GDP-mannose pyrophosphatase n=1 Tax=Breznakiella homolactica TaxID=2798577 RepID=A0A7T7XQK3_9SPIR|nr:NUDIX hydrolase [Breznakiella homolactica]QQO10677.1 NUDIX hydrolase [Breznakiella homolactica]
MKEYSHLIWTEESRTVVYTSPVFTVRENRSRSPRGREGIFTVIDASDWAIVVPVLESPRGREFVMVRQWRHGSQSMSLEFPGGVIEPGEDISRGALRELQEETGYAARKITKIGEFSPNPALMSNTAHFFLAEDLGESGKQDLDEDEFVDIELVKPEEVLRGMGRPPYVHALMASALSLYLALGRGL